MDTLKRIFLATASFYVCLLICEMLLPIISYIVKWDFAMATLPEWGVMFMTLFALIISIREYRAHKRREKMTVFSEYSKRYSEDANIKCVTKFLIGFYENKDTETEPSIYEKEMFLRFFEELEFMIEKKKIDKDDVAEFFVYYAVAAAMCEPFAQDTELVMDSDRVDVWRRYRHFVGRYYDELGEGIINDYQKHHPGSKCVKLQFKLPEEKSV